MDCNRDEALRAKEIAEQKFSSKDVAGAKKFALKALDLFPALEGINQMIATLNVYLAAEVKINGESDFYSILCLNALADEETMKKQYRKLALQLHPDKNKTIGAEGAFKLISEAWSVLSDKTRKMVYDQKRNIQVFQQTPSQTKRDHSASNSVDGFYDFTNNATTVKSRKKTTVAARNVAVPSRRPLKPKTFWTSCNGCRMQYEYLRVYLNRNLLCPNCHEAFLAEETILRSNVPDSSVSGLAPQQGREEMNHNSTTNNDFDQGQAQSTVQESENMSFQQRVNPDSDHNPNLQWVAFSKTTAASSSAAVQADKVVHQTYKRVRKECSEAQVMARKEARRKKRISKQAHNSDISGIIPDQEQPIPKTDRPAKRRKSVRDTTANYFGGNVTEISGIKAPSAEQCIDSKMDSQNLRANDVFFESCKARISSRQNNLSMMFPQIDIRKMLLVKAKVLIGKTLGEWNLAEAAKLEEKEKAKQIPKHQDNNNCRTAAEVNGVVIGGNKLDGSRNNSKQTLVEKNLSKNLVEKNLSKNSADPAKVVIQPVSIDVPDPDFHDFDKDRPERSFKAEQVWAIYDNEDGMPRFYALVQKVISLKPFKIRMSFLNSKSNSEWGPMNWVSSGFAKTCGDFRISKCEICDTVNIFSHRVKREKGARGAVKIVPKKGDTWALYRNWSPNWNVQTPDDVIYKYAMVEVLDDFDEEQGVSVTPLVKVAGFKTVFHRHLDPNEVKRIPREEMFRFSHQVPSYLLTGKEAHNAPVGCHELDPAATPLELLQVIREVNEDNVMKTAEQQKIS